MADIGDVGGGSRDLRVEAALVLRDLTEATYRNFEARGKAASAEVAQALRQINAEAARLAKELQDAAAKGSTALKRTKQDAGITEAAFEKLTRSIERGFRQVRVDGGRAFAGIDDRLARIETRGTRAFRVLASQVGRTRREVERLSRAGDGAFTGLGTGSAGVARGMSILRRRIIDVRVLLGTLFIGAALQGATDYQIELARIGTLLEDTRKQLPGLSKELTQLISDQGAARAEAANALYETISAQFTGDDAFEITGRAISLSRVGVSDQETAVKAVTAVLNAYELEAEDAARVSDLLFATIDKGTTTLQELGPVIGNIVPIAKNLGVSLEEVFAAITRITLTGASAGRAVTQVRSALVNLQRFLPRINAQLADYGITIDEDTLANEGLAGTLQLVADAAASAGIPLQSLIGRVEGLLGILNLTGPNAAAFRRELERFEGIDGIVARQDEIFRENPVVRLTEDLNRARNALQAIFDDIVAGLYGVRDAAQEATEALAGLPPERSQRRLQIDANRAGVAPEEFEALRSFGEFAISDPSQGQKLGFTNTLDLIRSFRDELEALSGTDISFVQLQELSEQLGNLAPQSEDVVERFAEVRQAFIELGTLIAGSEGQITLGVNVRTDADALKLLSLEVDEINDTLAQANVVLEVPVGADPSTFQGLARQLTKLFSEANEDVGALGDDFAAALAAALPEGGVEFQKAGSDVAQGVITGFTQSVDAQGRVIISSLVNLFKDAAEEAGEFVQARELLGGGDVDAGTTRLFRVAEPIAVTDEQAGVIAEQNRVLEEQLKTVARRLRLESSLADGIAQTTLELRAQQAEFDASIASQSTERSIAADEANQLIVLFERINRASLNDSIEEYLVSLQAARSENLALAAEVEGTLESQARAIRAASEEQIRALERQREALGGVTGNLAVDRITAGLRQALEERIELIEKSADQELKLAELLGGENDARRQTALLEAEIVGELELKVEKVRQSTQLEIEQLKIKALSLDAESEIRKEIEAQIVALEKLTGIRADRQSETRQRRDPLDPFREARERAESELRDATARGDEVAVARLNDEIRLIQDATTATLARRAAQDDLNIALAGNDAFAAIAAQGRLIIKDTNLAVEGAALLSRTYDDATQAIADWADGTKEAKEAGKDFLRSLLRGLNEVIIRQLFLNTLLGALFPGAGATPSLFSQGLAVPELEPEFFAKGGTKKGRLLGLAPVPGFGNLPVSAHAGGGTVNNPTLALFGEVPGQEEAFVPLQGGKIPVRLEQQAPSGGGVGGNSMSVIVEGIAISVQSLDPQGSLDAIRAAIPEIERELADRLESGVSRPMVNSIRRAGRGR